jgi:hypothetical protein
MPKIEVKDFIGAAIFVLELRDKKISLVQR